MDLMDFIILQANETVTAGSSGNKFKATNEGRTVAYVSLVVMAVLPIFYGSFRSIKYHQKQKKAYEESGVRPDTMSRRDAMTFPIIASGTLGGLYLVIKIFSKEYVNYLLSIYFFSLGVIALTTFLQPMFEKLFSGPISKVEYHLNFTKKEKSDKKPFNLIDFEFNTFDILSFVVSSIIGVWYFMKKHWVANNLFGIAFACSGIELLSLNKIANGCILLIGLFFYDVFWVFGTDVMVTVAQSFEAPIKLMFPQDFIESGFFGKHFAMLGLGDIVVPGIFIALLLRYDVSLKRKGRKIYFYTAFIAYILGLILTIVVMTVYNHAQPALLYLVPACVLTPLSVALIQGDLKSMFTYQDHDEENEKKETKSNGGGKKSKNSKEKKES